MGKKKEAAKLQKKFAKAVAKAKKKIAKDAEKSGKKGAVMPTDFRNLPKFLRPGSR